MYAQCPDCMTLFALDATTVAQAHGTVGCGHCGATFDALVTLTEDLPPEPFDSLPLHPSAPAPPILMMAVVRPQPPQPPLFELASGHTDTIDDADAPSASPADEDDAPAVPDDATPAMPSFAHRRRAAPRRHALRWALGCLALALCLGLQLVWAERATLATDATTGPVLRQACAWLHCTLPPVRDLSQLRLLSRDVRPHPSVPDALLISATVRNEAHFTQPYPVVSITLSDLDENRIAMRRFRPSEYLRDAAVREAGLAPGATAALVFEVKDPGQNAVAFQFGFQ